LFSTWQPANRNRLAVCQSVCPVLIICHNSRNV